MSAGAGVLRKVSNCSSLLTEAARRGGRVSRVAVSSVVSRAYLRSSSMTTERPFNITLLLPERMYLLIVK